MDDVSGRLNWNTFFLEMEEQEIESAKKHHPSPSYYNIHCISSREREEYITGWFHSRLERE